jgi:hypothetical protein
MPKFVIQHHTRDNHSHWDLMFERENHLATWQVSVGPAEWPDNPQNAVKIQNHRLDYLSYQGPISNNRGRVEIADQGGFDAGEISEIRWVVRLAGKILNGDLELQHIGDDRWLLTFHPTVLSPEHARNPGVHE